MMKTIIQSFHEYRLAENHGKAIDAIKSLKTRYSFTDDQIVTALVAEGF